MTAENCKKGSAKRILGRILLGLLIIILAVLILAPGFVRRYAEKHSPELIGRAVAINKLRVYYLAGKVRVTDLTMYEADGRNTFVSFDTLVVDLKPLRLIGHELFVQHFYLSGLSGFLVQEDSVFNFSDLTEKKPDGEPASVPVKDTTEKSEPTDVLVKDTLEQNDNTEKEAFKFNLYDIELRRAHFEYDIRDIGDTLLLRNISFAVPYIGWDQHEKSEAGLRLNLEKEGTLEANIHINPVEGDFDANLSLQKVNLGGFTKLLSNYLAIDSIRGSFHTTLDVLGNMNDPISSVVAGNIGVRDLSLTDTGKNKFFGAGDIRLDMHEIDLSRSLFLLDSVVVEEPYIYFEMKDSTTNFSEILGLHPKETGTSEQEDSENEPVTAETGESEPDSAAAENSTPIYYAVHTLKVEQGVIDFSAQVSGDPFNYHLSEILINNDSSKSGTDPITINASMLLNNRGDLKAEATIDPNSPGNFILDYTITDFWLYDLDIYSRYYVGFPILNGEMFYQGHTELADKQLVSDNHLIMDNVKFGEKVEGLHDLPLKLAFNVLEDNNRVVDLENEGSLPTFKVFYTLKDEELLK